MADLTVVTGANRGIGLAMAQEAVARGAVVRGTYRATHPEAEGLQWDKLDVTDPTSVRAFAATLQGAPVALLVCNAGVYPEKGENLETGYGADKWQAGFAVNVTGVFLMVQALLPNLRKAKGRVAIIASQMGSTTRAPGGSLIYRASKAAAVNLGRNLAVDLKPDGIAVGVYHPGWVQTDMGGTRADITPMAAAKGLLDRFAVLSVQNTGCFETWDGRAHPV
jgi:NAD(P)-dependent dehydrogenase (short-subunit alcohol dehydrogenase family)